jgi:hypothetical protein
LFESDEAEGEDKEGGGHWEGDGEGSEHGWDEPVCEVVFPETPTYTREDKPVFSWQRASVEEGEEQEEEEEDLEELALPFIPLPSPSPSLLTTNK